MLNSNIIISSHHYNDEIGLDINLTDVRSLQLASKIEKSALFGQPLFCIKTLLYQDVYYGYVNFFDIRMNSKINI